MSKRPDIPPIQDGLQGADKQAFEGYASELIPDKAGQPDAGNGGLYTEFVGSPEAIVTVGSSQPDNEAPQVADEIRDGAAVNDEVELDVSQDMGTPSIATTGNAYTSADGRTTYEVVEINGKTYLKTDRRPEQEGRGNRSVREMSAEQIAQYLREQGVFALGEHQSEGTSNELPQDSTDKPSSGSIAIVREDARKALDDMGVAQEPVSQQNTPEEASDKDATPVDLVPETEIQPQAQQGTVVVHSTESGRTITLHQSAATEKIAPQEYQRTPDINPANLDERRSESDGSKEDGAIGEGKAIAPVEFSGQEIEQGQKPETEDGGDAEGKVDEPKGEKAPVDATGKELLPWQEKSKELVPIKKDAPPEIMPELQFAAGMSKGMLKELVQKAMEITDRDQRANLEEFQKERRDHWWQNPVGKLRAGVKYLWKNTKYNTIFKLETQRKRAEELMFAAQEKMGESGNGQITLEQWREVLTKEGVEFTPDQEVAFLTSISENLFGPGEGAADHGNGSNESPAMVQLRAGLKEQVLAYVVAEGTSGISPEQRAEIRRRHLTEVNRLVTEYSVGNPNFQQEEMKVYVDNAGNLLESSLAIARHEDGMDKLSAQLDAMRIDIGQRQLGAYNNLDTTHIERTLAMAKTRRVGGVIGKASFVAGTWVAAGALAQGLGAWASQSASSKGAKTGAVALGGLLGGPVGMAAGFAAGMAVSSVWGRYMGRKRQGENARMAAISTAYAGDREPTAELTELSPTMTSYEEANAALYSFLEPKPGVSQENAAVTDWKIKDGLNQDNIAQLLTVMSRLQAGLNVEAAANKQQGRDRALNLFRAHNEGTIIAERNQMIMGLRTASDGISKQYRHVTIRGGEGRPGIGMVEFARAQMAEQTTATEVMLQGYEQRVKESIDRAGRKGALVGGIASGALGTVFAVGHELLTGGKANTIFDMFGHDRSVNTPNLAAVAQPASSAQGGNTSITIPTNYGQSGATISGNSALFTSPTGSKIPVTLGSSGEISPADVATLKSNGINIVQQTTPGSTQSVPVGSALNHLASQGKNFSVHDWNSNGTPRSDYAELGGDIKRTPDGSLHLVQWNGESGNGAGRHDDLLKAAADGSMQMRIEDVANGKAILLPVNVVDGHIEAVIPNDTPANRTLIDLIAGKSNKPGWLKESDVRNGLHIGPVINEGGEYRSVSTIVGRSNLGNIEIPTQGSTKIDVTMQVPESTEETAREYGTTIPGVVPTGTETVLGKRRSGTVEPAEPKPRPPEEPGGKKQDEGEIPPIPIAPAGTIPSAGIWPPATPKGGVDSPKDQARPIEGIPKKANNAPGKPSEPTNPLRSNPQPIGEPETKTRDGATVPGPVTPSGPKPESSSSNRDWDEDKARKRFETLGGHSADILAQEHPLFMRQNGDRKAATLIYRRLVRNYQRMIDEGEGSKPIEIPAEAGDVKALAKIDYISTHPDVMTDEQVAYDAFADMEEIRRSIETGEHTDADRAILKAKLQEAVQAWRATEERVRAVRKQVGDEWDRQQGTGPAKRSSSEQPSGASETVSAPSQDKSSAVPRQAEARQRQASDSPMGQPPRHAGFGDKPTRDIPEEQPRPTLDQILDGIQRRQEARDVARTAQPTVTDRVKSAWRRVREARRVQRSEAEAPQQALEQDSGFETARANAQRAWQAVKQAQARRNSQRGLGVTAEREATEALKSAYATYRNMVSARDQERRRVMAHLAGQQRNSAEK